MPRSTSPPSSLSASWSRRPRRKISRTMPISFLGRWRQHFWLNPWTRSQGWQGWTTARRTRGKEKEKRNRTSHVTHGGTGQDAVSGQPALFSMNRWAQADAEHVAPASTSNRIVLFQEDKGGSPRVVLRLALLGLELVLVANKIRVLRLLHRALQVGRRRSQPQKGLRRGPEGRRCSEGRGRRNGVPGSSGAIDYDRGIHWKWGGRELISKSSSKKLRRF